MAFRGGNKKLPEMGELNLAPIMNLMVTLIPMLLLSISFIELVLLETSLPVFSNNQQQLEEEINKKKEKPKLGLTIAITEEGFIIGGQGGLLRGLNQDPLIARRTGGEYDYVSLSDKLIDIKSKFPDEWSVIIVPDAEVKFDVIVSTMDASREHNVIDTSGKKARKLLFPNVVIGGGVM
jgi:biopolymer transport protein ExbD